jgi:RimJ/RimL family protein N-acetyltransferase
MRIEGDGFVLRPERPGDAPAMARAFGEDPQLAIDWGIDDAPDESTALAWTTEHAELWARGEGRHFAVADLETSEMIGGVNFHNIRPDHRRAEIGFWLVPGRRSGRHRDALAAGRRARSALIRRADRRQRPLEAFT